MRFQIKSVLLNHSMVFRRTLNHFKSSLKVHLCDYSYYVWNLKVTERWKTKRMKCRFMYEQIDVIDDIVF